jgi:Mg-chelatase subunit ChlD
MNRFIDLVSGWFSDTRNDPEPEPATRRPASSTALTAPRQQLPARLPAPASLPQPVREPWTIYSPDRIGIVGFHDRGFIIARPATSFAPWLVERSQSLHTRLGGLTNMTDGLRQALALTALAPPGVFRKIWLLSDGEPNVETESLFAIVHACRETSVKINTIGFGDGYNRQLLEQIAAGSHYGRFISVHNLRELSQVLAGATPPAAPHRHRSEATILAIDCSSSMQEAMEDRSKIQVVEEAILHLLHFKQRLFS